MSTSSNSDPESCPIEALKNKISLNREMEEEAYAWNSETRRSEKTVKRAKGYARYRAVVTDGKGDRATGTKSEKAVSFPDFIEKAETGAIGRALAALGYGTQFAPELNEEHRIVDAPVERNSYASSSDGNVSGQHDGTSATERDARGRYPARRSAADVSDRAGSPRTAGSRLQARCRRQGCGRTAV